MRPPTVRRLSITALALCAVLAGGCGPPPSLPAGQGTTPATPPATPSAPSGPPTSPPSPPSTGASPSAPSGAAAPTLATPSPVPARCAALADSLSLRDRVGQLLMVAVSSAGVGPSAAQAVEQSRAGSVLLLGNTTAGADRVLAVTEQARDAARHPKGIDTMLAADQEGGLVQRLRGPGFDRIPAAEQQADESPAQLRRDATRWGRQLRRAGIDADLAPVADVVPRDLRDLNQPIGALRRGYGSSPAAVASSVTAFVEGMDAAGVATSVKHFPGLGRVRGNTDFTALVVDRTTTRHDRSLKPFAAGIDAGTDMVMLSSAYYTRIDPKRRATFSPVVIGEMLRGDLGFTGVVISDDLAAVAMRDLAPGTRMLRFLRAGGDLAIVGDPSIAAAMADAVVAQARDDPKLAASIERSTVRVLRLKDRRGMARC